MQFAFSRNVLAPVLLMAMAGCGKPQVGTVVRQMGEQVEIGQLSYLVVESMWRTQLGQGLNVRLPQNRFLMLTIAITNKGASDAAIPLLHLESLSGQTYRELSDGADVTDWLGILRRAGPEQTIEGRVLFDVPLAPFRLRLPGVDEAGNDRYAWVEIPRGESP